MADTITDLYRVKKAKELLNSNYHLWLGLAGGDLIWPDNSTPPIPSPNILELPDLLGLIYVHNKKIIRPDPAGRLKTIYGSFSYVSNVNNNINLVNQQAVYLYLEAALPLDTILLGSTYRIMALCENVNLVSPNNSLLGKYSYLAPEDISSYDLIWLNTLSAKEITPANNTIHLIKRF